MRRSNTICITVLCLTLLAICWTVAHGASVYRMLGGLTANSMNFNYALVPGGILNVRSNTVGYMVAYSTEFASVKATATYNLGTNALTGLQTRILARNYGGVNGYWTGKVQMLGFGHGIPSMSQYITLTNACRTFNTALGR